MNNPAFNNLLSSVPAPTNLFELATFPEPIFSDRFFFSSITHPATFVSTILGIKNLPREQWQLLTFGSQEISSSDMCYFYGWNKDEDIFRMFLLFMNEMFTAADAVPGSFYISPSTDGY